MERKKMNTRVVPIPPAAETCQRKAGSMKYEGRSGGHRPRVPRKARDLLLPISYFRLRTFFPLALSFLIAGCAAPTVNLATNEPIKVDIAMRLDVYQHSKDVAKKGSPPAAAPGNSDPEARRRNRMADIQTFKNSRLVGEGRDGLLSVRVETPGDYGDTVRKIVSEENADRTALMKAAAEKEKLPLPDIQAGQAELWRKTSFEGELIEVNKPDGTWSWMQKSGSARR